MGRPSEFTQDVADDICERIAGGESLRAICETDGMPNKATVCRWLAAHPQFSDQYTHAREMQADTLFDDCLAIADGSSNIAGEDIQDRKLQIDTRKWMAGKLRGKYSDKVKHVGGDEGDAPIAITGIDIRIIDPTEA